MEFVRENKVLSHKTSFSMYIYDLLSIYLFSFCRSYVHIFIYLNFTTCSACGQPAVSFFLYIQTSAYWWKESRWSATTGHTHTQKGFFFSSSFFLFWIKKRIINTIKEIYIKKSHFFTIFKWCPLLRNFIHETCVIFSPLLLILYRMFFLSLFHVVQWIWNMNRHSVTVWVAMVTRWFWRFSLLFHNTTRILFNLSYVHTSSKKGRKYRVRYGFWGQSIGRNICLSLFLKVIQDWQFFFLPSIYRHLL